MYLGIDFGTSGCRAIVIDQQHQTLASASHPLPAPNTRDNQITQNAEVWLVGLRYLLKQLGRQFDLRQIQRIAVDGTSASVLITNEKGQPLSPALMYNDASSSAEVSLIEHHSPAAEHLCMTATSSLAKAIQLKRNIKDYAIKILHQADFLSNYLIGDWGISDYHNSLKLGYDLEQNCWPQWVSNLFPEDTLPEVVAPGSVIGTIQPERAAELGLNPDCEVRAGSTDANAAFIATGCAQPGDAVTSLGSTIVLKILDEHPVQQLQTGVYSHRLGNYWLCSGGSNAGAGILRHYFNDQELQRLSAQIDVNKSTGLNYYPLISKGERFPVNDPNKEPMLKPRPDSNVDFLHGLLEGLSRIEKAGYEKLASLGTRKPTRILTMGGGAVNPQWQAIRSRMLGIPVLAASHTQAAYGSALIAHQGIAPYINP